ncbi:MAG: potassium channel family protein [Methylovulum sp.]|nr:potassium channel family protein [Methylovulum sp.]
MRLFTECHNAVLWGDSLRIGLFKSKPLAYLVLLAVITTLAVGLLLFLIDPNIGSPLDGIWSAWVTMTHVGFGDVVPVSFLGRLLAAALILFGLVFFSLFTALISVTLIGKNMDSLGGGVLRIEQEANSLQGSEDRILVELVYLNERMEALEKLLAASRDVMPPINPVPSDTDGEAV